ncbi:thioesterase II family protein [Grimontia marina]|uniref:Linear gramicidin dehydrogenase LgrE n=1 Tax=Grimontia marina TaxID=646534 RepID=A0A128FAI7_9GAMM|nr:thioesterase domain-containing protein [Grimontia marina]CZF83758.1 Linear gramicidin dehydrogenase LgrE [Grimontia marina]
MLSSNWFVSTKTVENPCLRLFCFPYAGGNASTFLSWSNMIPANVELIAIQPPGRAGRLFEPAFSSMEGLVSSLVDEIKEYLDVPYMMFGHSLGSRVALEVAHQIKAKGFNQPSHFFASGSRSPNLPVSDIPLSKLGDEELIGKLKEMKDEPDPLLENKELMALFLPTLRADLAIADTYSAGADVQLHCELSVLNGQLDTAIQEIDIEGWRDFFSGSMDAKRFSGGHLFVDNACDELFGYINSVIQTTLDSPYVK